MSNISFAKVRSYMLSSTGVAIAAFTLFVPSAVMAQATDADTIETVTVTGSRLGGGFDAPTPVTVINAEQVKLSGVVNAEDVLNTNPQFRPDAGKFSNGAPAGNATLNLRGLGAQRNLVLVNGRRYTIQGPDQTTDINTIPTALIARTEVVTGGSSAVYGSDAIAGVVNFIMKDNFQGLQMDGHTDFDSITTTVTEPT